MQEQGPAVCGQGLDQAEKLRGRENGYSVTDAHGLEMSEIARYQSVRRPCNRDFEKRQIGWIGKNKIGRSSGDVFARKPYELQKGNNVRRLEREHRPQQYITVFRQNPVIK